jgi:hypothetical protein
VDRQDVTDALWLDEKTTVGEQIELQLLLEHGALVIDFGEEPVHGVGLMFEQKETKETKNRKCTKAQEGEGSQGRREPDYDAPPPLPGAPEEQHQDEPGRELGLGREAAYAVMSSNPQNAQHQNAQARELIPHPEEFPTDPLAGASG